MPPPETRTWGIFGASLSRQCLEAGLLDEIVIQLAPVLLGGGVALYGDGDDGRVELERISLGEAEQLTDLRFRVVKPEHRGCGPRGRS